ncbi:MAG TPA: hypothetical protein VFZ59_07685 [Verrucomicrobiae bacterium]|nr:hypothetical protein [Verrucomicrobiae bacterium]
MARGEKLTLAELAPPAVPDDKNFAMDSIWVEAVTTQMGAEKAMTWYGDRVRAFGETNKARLFDLKAELPEVLWMTSNESGRWQLATTTDLTLWQDYYRRLAHRTNYFLIPSKPRSPAEDVLLALSRNNNIIEQLREASALPYARFPLDYASKNPGEILLPHLSMLKSVIFVLRLRTSAELQAGSSDSALDDIVLMMRFNDLIRDEPFLISQLIHIAMFQIEVQPIWEGLADQRWNDPQLAHLDAHLAQFDFLKSYTNVMAREKASVCQIVDYLERNRRDLKGAYEPLGPLLPLPRGFRENEALLNCFALAIPRGWFDQNKATVWRFYDEHVDRAIDLAHRTYSSSNAVQLSGAASRLGAAPSPYNRLANMLLPALTQAAKKFVFAQETLDFARLAIALERYRLANGRFPEKLDALSPKFLGQIPHDLITGKPLKYRRTEDGSFILYSVGWNATDDAGKVSQIPGGAPNPELGDWVWRYPQSKLQL